jgi:hypothetical protein
MLRARRRGIFKREYDILFDGEQVTSLVGRRRESCDFSLGGNGYRIERVDRRRFRLLGPTGQEATAERQTSREWRIHAGTGNLTLTKPSLWRSGWEIHQRGTTRGEIHHDGAFKRTFSAGVPTDVPLPVGVFTLYVVLVIFERQAAAAAAAAGS